MTIRRAAAATAIPTTATTTTTTSMSLATATATAVKRRIPSATPSSTGCRATGSARMHSWESTSTAPTASRHWRNTSNETRSRSTPIAAGSAAMPCTPRRSSIPSSRIFSSRSSCRGRLPWKHRSRDLTTTTVTAPLLPPPFWNSTRGTPSGASTASSPGGTAGASSPRAPASSPRRSGPTTPGRAETPGSAGPSRPLSPTGKSTTPTSRLLSARRPWSGPARSTPWGSRPGPGPRRKRRPFCWALKSTERTGKRSARPLSRPGPTCKSRTTPGSTRRRTDGAGWGEG
mmetsp:Transcript_7649/g.22409  ORF Transcript_7649/g.22409 Transcript_7649/m.22409 type:complete len:288 (-) Transcript_7649:1347-2210(-)